MLKSETPIWITNLLESLLDGPVKYGQPGSSTAYENTKVWLENPGYILIENGFISITSKGKKFLRGCLENQGVL